LYAYALPRSAAHLEDLVDPRFKLIARGSAPNWEDLAGHWAVPGYDSAKFSSLQDALSARETYGQKIIKLYTQLLNTNIPEAPPTDEGAALESLLKKNVELLANWF
jgi:hypothetical protein